MGVLSVKERMNMYQGLTGKRGLVLFVAEECLTEVRVIIVAEKRLIKRSALHSMGDKLAIVSTYS
jgi:hypothetical protein